MKNFSLKYKLLTLTLITLFVSALAADIPFTFKAGEVISAEQMNQNFAALNTAKQERISGNCPAGSSIRSIATDGKVVCEVDDIGSSGSSGVDAINSMTGAVVLQAGDNITIDDSTAGQIVISATDGGGNTNNHDHFGQTWEGTTTQTSTNGFSVISTNTTADGSGIYAKIGTDITYDTDEAAALRGESGSAIGVLGVSDYLGVSGVALEGVGVSGSGRTGVSGYGRGGGAGVYGVGNDDSTGVIGSNSNNGIGVSGFSNNGIGVEGKSSSNSGVSGESTLGFGVFGKSKSFSGVHGESETGIGIYGFSPSFIGIEGISTSGYGIYGYSTSNVAIYGSSISDTGVFGKTDLGNGIWGVSKSGSGVFGQSTSGYSGYFAGGGGGSGYCRFNGGAGWSCTSDKHAKENFESINSVKVLESLAAMPITRWNMKDDANQTPHIGPVAQDFYEAFGLGEDDVTINTSDAQGVALAAIQGLYQLVQEQQVLIEAQQAQLEELQERLAQQ